MGLFGKLFEKKECAICGGEIGLLGNRKLEDGNMCKECAAKLSPWFSDRKHSTVEEIKQQLDYRARNYEELKAFQPTKTIGQRYKMYVEERNGVPYRFVVSDENDFRKENADIILFENVTSCEVDIEDYRRELQYRNEEGEMVDYNPPRYEYNYDFYVKMLINNNLYFDDIRFKLNNSSIVMSTERPGTGFGQFSLTNTGFDPSYHPEYRRYKEMCDEISETVARSRQPMYGQQMGYNQQPNYNQAPVQPQAPVQAAGPKFCSNCGAKADGGKFCQFCGTPL